MTRIFPTHHRFLSFSVLVHSLHHTIHAMDSDAALYIIMSCWKPERNVVDLPAPHHFGKFKNAVSVGFFLVDDVFHHY